MPSTTTIWIIFINDRINYRLVNILKWNGQCLQRVICILRGLRYVFASSLHKIFVLELKFKLLNSMFHHFIVAKYWVFDNLKSKIRKNSSSQNYLTRINVWRKHKHKTKIAFTSCAWQHALDRTRDGDFWNQAKAIHLRKQVKIY